MAQREDVFRACSEQVPFLSMIAVAFQYSVSGARHHHEKSRNNVAELLSACKRESELGAPSFARYDADIGKVAVTLGVIQTEADHEFVRDRETNVVALQGQFTARRLVEQSCNFQRSRLMG